MTDPDAKDFLDIELLKLRIEALEEWKAWASGVLKSVVKVLNVDTEE